MDRAITRRDFLNGVAIGAGGLLAADPVLAALIAEETSPEKAPGYYPPALTGMRGNHDGTFTYAHQLRDGKRWDAAGGAAKTGEIYDLVVVGGGISGLAAAYFYRKSAGKSARILILDNHDDFGGHAKRNEFRAGGRMLLTYGGTQSIESPGKYSDVAKGLLAELGIQTDRFYKAYDRTLYSKLGTAAFFDKETFGADRLLTGMNATPWPEFLAQAPLSDGVRREIARVYTERVDYLPGLSKEEKLAKLEKISYADYLAKYCKLVPEALPFFQTFTHDLFCVGIEAVSAAACYEAGDDYQSFTYPGFDGLGLPEREKEEPYIFHFPDGNATVVRLLVRQLIPGSIPGSTMEDVVTGKADYSKLDTAENEVRIRLGSTAGNAKQNLAEGAASEVSVAYARDGKVRRAKARHCILACYNAMVPYLCPQLPRRQKEALQYCVKAPFIYTHVAIRNWEAFQKLGIHQIMAPGGYHSFIALDFPVSIGEYKFPSKPEEPAVLFMLRTPCSPGALRRDQYRAGRYELLSTKFETIERNIRDQLQRMLGGAGFDAARDVEAITVNRWAHGYAYEYDSYSDHDLPPGPRPNVIARKPFGNITIANSDSAARAYTDAAIDEAYRAVRELPGICITTGGHPK